MIEIIVSLFTSVYNWFQPPQQNPNPPVILTESPKKSSKIVIGINVNTIADYSPQIPFLDAFKFSRPWIWEGPYTPITTKINNKGWLTSVQPPTGIPPGSLASTVFFTDLYDYPIRGQYVVLYEGEGKLQYKHGASKNEALSKPGRDVIDVDTTRGTPYLQIVSTDPRNQGNYIRNIRVVRAQHEKTHTDFYSQKSFNPSTGKIFNPDFVARLRGFKIIRFMDWMATNGSNQVRWSDRPLLTEATWTKKGVPVEIMVALANQEKTDPWFNMPHMANDDYVRKFAEYVKNNLAPERKIYLEYTNEAWNDIFPQARWVDEQAKIAGITRHQWYARRSAQMINIWKQVFGDQSHRVIGVLSAQAANTETGRTALEYLKSQGLLSAINAIAIAPYFGHYLGTPEYATQVQNLSLDDLFQELTKGGIVRNSKGKPAVVGGALQQSYEAMQNYVNLSREYNLELMAYEGGQHLAGILGVENNQAITNLFIAANRDPRMGDVYRQYLNTWKGLGGGTFIHYEDLANYTKWGSWGAMQNLNDINNPKYRALKEMIEAKP